MKELTIQYKNKYKISKIKNFLVFKLVFCFSSAFFHVDKFTFSTKTKLNDNTNSKFWLFFSKDI